MPRLSADTPFIHPECEITNSRFGAFVEIGKGSRVSHSVFGDYSYCDRYADVANAQIGKFANIAAFSRIGATDHPLGTAACHHFLYRSHDYWEDATNDEDFFAHRKSRIARIGHDTWIGAGAMIKPEVTLGDGAVVAAGAVVTKDVDPYTIVAGAPAKPLRQRQPREIADRLIALAWWDWSHDALRVALKDFRALDAETFLDRYDG
ncbi:DapH/DapD/GlmU-related protein [Jannaschia sp. M317]|uniref:DapH/DapD/GlmU-related protein n=1 Tax=Jannaschia sp. M317 TaxID=2867011 RepID=UPI0021A78C46|nr:DapH/DapD/GlmU-related protein [Jannaschia sp. M317]UWQ16780.1 chloramphenicol acetyltransferase [Jannaschia sp. M317]